MKTNERGQLSSSKGFRAGLRQSLMGKKEAAQCVWRSCCWSCWGDTRLQISKVKPQGKAELGSENRKHWVQVQKREKVQYAASTAQAWVELKLWGLAATLLFASAWCPHQVSDDGLVRSRIVTELGMYILWGPCRRVVPFLGLCVW